MKFFVSTGEASGDLHLSYLVKSVKARYKDVDFVGVAGEKSQKEGVEILQDINELAIMGFTEVLKKYKFLKQKAYEYLQYIKDNQIKNVILVDYGGFNVKFLELLKNEIKDIKIFYYIPPKVWIWGEKRVEKLRLADYIMVIFPWEVDFYKKHNISAFGSIGVLIIQLPILIAMYRVVQIFVSSRADLGKYVYDFVKNLPVANNLVSNPDQFNQNFLGIIDLTQHAVSKDGVIIGLLVLAGVAAYLQYLTSKQLSPQSDSKRKLRDILAEAGGGKEADQSEVNAIMTRKMMKFMPLMMFMVTIYLPAALALYLATASAVGYLQNHIILKQDSLEMEEVANKKIAPQKSIASAKTKKRAKQATEARITRIKAKG